jgi:hypothetical protein
MDVTQGVTFMSFQTHGNIMEEFKNKHKNDDENEVETDLDRVAGSSTRRPTQLAFLEPEASPGLDSDSDDDTIYSLFAEEEPGSKRRRTGAPLKEASGETKQTGKPEQTQIPAVLKIARRKLEDFAKFVEGNRNVHKRIKGWAKELPSIQKRVASEYREMKEALDDTKHRLEAEREEHRRKYEALAAKCEALRRESEEARAATCSTCSKRLLEEKGTDTRAMDFRKFEELAEVLERKWTKESYALTKVEYRDPLRPNVENLVVFCDEQPDKWPKNIKRVIDTYPDVKDAEKVPCEGGSYGVLEQIMKIRTSKEAKGYEERRKCFVAAFLDSSKEDRNVEKDVFHVTREIRKLFGNEASTNVRMTLSQGIQEGKMRKIVEATFKGFAGAVTIKAQKRQIANSTANRRTSGNAIIVSANEQTYAETLKTLRNQITDEEILKGIKKVQKTNKGEVLLLVEDKAGESTAKRVGSALQSKGQEIRYSMGKSRTKTIHIRDIYGVAELEEIKEAVTEAVNGGDKGKIEIKSLRPAQRGTQTATVTLDHDWADKLISRRTIRIGMCMCRIQERVDLGRCYKCWCYGHIASACRGTDRTKLCLNCAQDGHKKSECGREAFCPLCERMGHAAGAGSCKIFREALETARRNKRGNESAEPRRISNEEGAREPSKNGE